MVDSNATLEVNREFDEEDTINKPKLCVPHLINPI